MKKSFIKIYLQVMLIVGSLSVFVFALDLVVPFLNDFLDGFSLSFGITLIAFSLIAQNSKKFIRKVEIAENDERMVMIKQKTMSAGFYFTLITNILAIIIFGAFESTYYVSLVLAGILLLHAIFIQVMNYIYKRKN